METEEQFEAPGGHLAAPNPPAVPGIQPSCNCCCEGLGGPSEGSWRPRACWQMLSQFNNVGIKQQHCLTWDYLLPKLRKMQVGFAGGSG